MLFDKLAGFVEKSKPEFVSVVNEARLFNFPYDYIEVLKSKGLYVSTSSNEAWSPFIMVPKEEVEAFVLPFPVTALEDVSRLVIMWEDKERLVGVKEPRNFIIYRTVAMGEMLENRPPDEVVYSFTKGLISYDIIEDEIFGKWYFPKVIVQDWVMYSEKGELLMSSTPLVLEEWRKDEQRYIVDTLPFGVAVTKAAEELLLSLQTPEYFVLEKTPVKLRKVPKGRVARSMDRPQYVLLSPDAIRKEMGLRVPTEGTGGSKRPHERRRHWRTLRSEKFVHRQGERILIDAVWIGPSEAVVGKTWYKVRLDV